MPYLIDGHNVIAALDDIDLEDPHDEAKLVMRLRAWTARINRRAIVIFDGGIPGGPSPTLSTTDVKVVFAARHHTNADRIIRERIQALPDPSNWTVVSSDHEILDRARSVGTQTLTAQGFVDTLERAQTPEPEKPASMSQAELEAWLEIFPEPEESPTDPEPDQQPSPSPTWPRSPRKPSVSQRARPSTPQKRHTRTIAEQMGAEVPPAPDPPEPSEKPAAPSEAEVAAWLEVFHDDPESRIPPPKLPKREKRPRRSAPAVVRKEGDLSPAEVDSWLALFETEEDAEPSDRRPGSHLAPAEDPASHRRPKSAPPETTAAPSDPDSKLVKRKQKLAPAEDEKAADLSEEDLALWRRLFGEK